MKNRAEIWNELKDISPAVAGISHAEVYIVPDGYFAAFSDRVITLINAETGEEENAIAITDRFTKNIPFSVPAKYFEEFAENLMMRIYAENAGSATEELEILSPFLNRLDKKNPFSVPAGFFTELSDTMNSGVKAIEFVNTELENLSPLMANLKNKNVYEAPSGYFNSFSDSVLAKIKAQPKQAKIISIFSKKRSWLKYYAAAVLIGLIATGSLLLFNKHTSYKMDDPVQGLSQVSDQEMLNYLDNQSTPAISADPSTNNNNNIASADNPDNDFKDLFSEVSDDDLQQYVNDNVPTKDLIMN